MGLTPYLILNILFSFVLGFLELSVNSSKSKPKSKVQTQLKFSHYIQGRLLSTMQLVFWYIDLVWVCLLFVVNCLKLWICFSLGIFCWWLSIFRDLVRLASICSSPDFICITQINESPKRWGVIFNSLWGYNFRYLMWQLK